jgi:hypothetical protein
MWRELNNPRRQNESLYTFLLNPCCEREIPLPLKRDRDDKLFCVTEEEEAAIRNEILFMKYFTRESPLLPLINQLHNCHPEQREGSPDQLNKRDI